MFKDFILGLATKGLMFICQNSQCISETLFSFKTAKFFNLKNAHKEAKSGSYTSKL